MKKIIASVVLTCLLGIWTGCNKDDGAAAKPVASGANSVGVVDLDRVGKAVGWTDDIKKNQEQAAMALRVPLEGRLKAAQRALEQRKSDIAAANKFTKDQIDAMNKAAEKSDLEKLGLTSQQIEDFGKAIAAVRNEQINFDRANQFMQQRQIQIIKAYREAASPVVRRVAVANNRAVVLYPNPDSGYIAYWDPSADLTDKVIDDLNHAPPLKVNLPDLPRLEAQMPMTAPTAPASGAGK